MLFLPPGNALLSILCMLLSATRTEETEETGSGSLESRVRGNVHTLFGGEGLVLLTDQDPAPYPTLFVRIASTGQLRAPIASPAGNTPQHLAYCALHRQW